jgi:hypothetical protein
MDNSPLNNDFLEETLADIGSDFEFIEDSLVEQVVNHLENDYIKEDDWDNECIEELEQIEKEEENQWDQLCVKEVDKIDKV